MQGTVATYDGATRSGSVFLDDGSQVPFGAAALAGTGLRFLRPGQRVKLETTADGEVGRIQHLTFD